jgi:phosphoribosylaminoimidazolecarboxamide formyltransferase / IMP cyclohydrolase
MLVTRQNNQRGIVMKNRALISVSDKTGVVELSRSLADLGFEIISTGGTYSFLKENGVDVMKVESVTGFSECFDGRVKTLHPLVHGGILHDRENGSHVEDAMKLGIVPIDVVVVNLYPFRKVYVDPASTHEEKIENIDIGGPSMVRGAAKNFKDVILLTDPNDYGWVLERMAGHSGEPRGDGNTLYGVSLVQRQELARKAFRMTSGYDALIAGYFLENSIESGIVQCAEEMSSSDDSVELNLRKVSNLRYGENPQQEASLYSVTPSVLCGANLTDCRQLGGKECSFNNYLDMNSAVSMVMELDDHACVAVKHNNPCGVALGRSALEAFQRAYECDRVSIFGGVVAFNCEVDEECAKALKELFLEVVIAPSFTEEAVSVLSAKKNLRIMEMAGMNEGSSSKVEIKSILGGYLLQTVDMARESVADLKLATSRRLSDRELDDALSAVRIVKHVKSNGIVLFRDGQMTGVGSGQTSRIWALQNAVERSTLGLEGSVMASDGFFPFADCIELAAKHGIMTVVHPGGSMKDEEIRLRAEELGISLIVTGMRHFKH